MQELIRPTLDEFGNRGRGMTRFSSSLARTLQAQVYPQAFETCRTIYIKPGSLWQSGFVESFHGRFRDECLIQKQLWMLPATETDRAPGTLRMLMDILATGRQPAPQCRQVQRTVQGHPPGGGLGS